MNFSMMQGFIHGNSFSSEKEITGRANFARTKIREQIFPMNFYTKKIKVEAPGTDPLLEENRDLVIKKKISNVHAHKIVYLSMFGDVLVTASDKHMSEKTCEEKTWNVHTGECISQSRVSEVRRTQICAGRTCSHKSPDNTTIVGHSYYRDYISCDTNLLNPDARSHSFALKGHTSEIRHVEFLTNTLLASCSWDKTIKIWSLPQQRCVLTLQHDGPIGKFIVDSTRTKIISVEQHEPTMYIWDIASYAKERRDLITHLRVNCEWSPMHKTALPEDIYKIICNLASLNAPPQDVSPIHKRIRDLFGINK
jgi:WD40 repeat protein